jgi:hypothetical protein
MMAPNSERFQSGRKYKHASVADWIILLLHVAVMQRHLLLTLIHIQYIINMTPDQTVDKDVVTCS